MGLEGKGVSGVVEHRGRTGGRVIYRRGLLPFHFGDQGLQLRSPVLEDALEGERGRIIGRPGPWPRLRSTGLLPAAANG